MSLHQYQTKTQVLFPYVCDRHLLNVDVVFMPAVNMHKTMCILSDIVSVDLYNFVKKEEIKTHYNPWL